MAMNKIALRNRITTKIQALMGFTWTAPQLANAEKVWEAVADAIIEEIQANAKINFVANDFKIDAGTFVVGVTPVTGQGQNATITGKGSIS